jgi:dihydroorotase
VTLSAHLTQPDPAEQLYSAPRPAADVLIRHAHVLDPRARIDEIHDVLVRGGQIAEIGDPGALRVPDGATTVEARGRHLLPAFVDPHVHLRTPGQEYKEDILTGTAAAAAGGYCAIVAMPNTSPTVDTASVVGALVARARAEARVPTGFLAAITRGLAGEELTEMAELRDAGAIGFTDDGKPVASAGMLRKALQYQRLAGGIIALHEEDPALSGQGVMHEGAVSARLGMTGIPSLSESTMVARDAALARYEDARVHFQHLSCVESVEALQIAKNMDPPARVSAEVSPHHLALTDAEVESLDSRFKMNPPLRSEADRQALIEGLRSGVIDCVATDHAPHAAHEKEVPFEEAPMGTTGLETAFAAVYTELVKPGVLGLDVLAERMTAGGALYGLLTPRIAVGETANLTLVDLEASWVAGEDGYASRSSNCSFDGRRLHGRVLLTIAAGAIVYQRPMLVAASDQEVARSRTTHAADLPASPDGERRRPA